jgi:SPP1 gp7 family putative phage head morphogenesis protein
MMTEQVAAIVSIPAQAASRIAEGVDVRSVSHWVATKADMMSRNQVARVATAVLRLRAQYLGSEGYIWRTAKDARVRVRHRALEGKFFRWGDPPVVDDKGLRGHPGDADGCRCIPEPVVGEYR